MINGVGVGAVPFKETQGGGEVPRHAAVSLQMQDWEDAVNHPEWQRDERIHWDTDELYVTYSRYRFHVDRDSSSG